MAPADELSAVGGQALRPATMRGREGFYRVGQDTAGRWWLVDPSGSPFFFRGVHGVRTAGDPPDSAFTRDSAARLRAWGFNAVGVGRDSAGRDDGLPFLASVDFVRTGPQLIAPGLRLPDMFDPEWLQLASARAHEVCTPLAGNPALVGWVTDDTVEWASPPAAGRPSLLQICLSLEPSFAAYHAAWEFVLASHGGRLEAVARAWAAALPNKEVVRELTRSDVGLATRGYHRDDLRWTRECARRYFAATSTALRAADANHLVFGCRFSGKVAAQVLAECTYPAVDVALPHWLELPPADAIATQPVLANDVAWVEDERSRPGARVRTPRLTTFERMLRRSRTTIDRMARHPAVVGYAWSQWEDAAGEQPPFARGLVHVNGSEAREHTEVLTAFNARAEELHRG